MEKETLYKFFDGKASREEKEAVRIWLESSPENEQMLFREREFFDAMILSGSTKSAGSFLPDCLVRSHEDCCCVCHYYRLRNVFL